MTSKFQTRIFEHGKIVRVIDGDTAEIEIDLGFSVKFKAIFRLAHIDTPERGKPGWREATDYLRRFIDLPVVVHSKKMDKYGRYLAIINVEGQTETVNQQLINLGLAKAYFGDGKNSAVWVE